MSTVVLDTITGKSTATTITIGSTPVVSASANSMTIRGEGSNQTSIQQGLAKAWHIYKSTDTFAVLDSLNGASATDHGTGDHTTTVTNAFASVNYTNHFSAEFNESDSKVVSGASHQHSSAKSTTALRHAFQNTSAEGRDGFQNTVTKHGDLA